MNCPRTLPAMSYSVRILFLIMLLGLFSSALAEAPESVPGATTISTGKAKALFDSQVLFVDVRSASRYAEGRIASAINLELEDTLTKEALEKVAAKDTPIVFYCDGISCGRSAIAAKIALSWGFTSVYYYREGFPVWNRAGFPIEP